MPRVVALPGRVGMTPFPCGNRVRKPPGREYRGDCGGLHGVRAPVQQCPDAQCPDIPASEREPDDRALGRSGDTDWLRRARCNRFGGRRTTPASRGASPKRATSPSCSSNSSVRSGVPRSAHRPPATSCWSSASWSPTQLPAQPWAVHPGTGGNRHLRDRHRVRQQRGPAPRYPRDPERVGRHGLEIVHALATEVTVGRVPVGKCVKAQLALRR